MDDDNETRAKTAEEAGAVLDEARVFDDSPEKEQRAELAATIATLKGDLEAQTKARDALLAKCSLTMERARQLTDEHIDRLHRYNDIKDAGQMLFGKLAELKGKTVKGIYKEYSVNIED
ncbi:swi5-like zinc finger protein [Coemansia sp. S610]|nr:swi5-like zinc finger protein [Coemansia sp. S610]KAJ2364306.1 swi5-like zinc finger protein [Coemansia sp. RSA 2611]KAJ2401841.1 swi5-like zinc finger protein [Coemansia sp. RSA 2530]KAJ2700292.1 swi5-like zinc finger protein [Coemansia sp. IMI 209128]